MALPHLLRRPGPILLDGAMATNLFDAGLGLQEPAELWTLAHPDRVQALHRAFVAAGASILLTNTFGANALRLAAHGLEARMTELNRHAARLAREAAQAAARTVLVAGSMGPCGQRPEAGDPHPAGRAGFRRQAEALAQGGADLLWLETMGDAVEIRLAAEAAAATGLPYVVTASFDEAGRAPGGIEVPGFVNLVEGLPVRPAAFGANCGLGPDSVVAAVRAMRAASPGALIVAKASAGLPEVRDGRLAYPIDPDGMASFARAAAVAGARLIGGCCGTTPAHGAAMRDALELSAA